MDIQVDTLADGRFEITLTLSQKTIYKFYASTRAYLDKILEAVEKAYGIN